MFWFVEHHSSSAVIPICGINIVLHTKIYQNHKRIYIYMDKFYQLNSISLSISLSPLLILYLVMPQNLVKHSENTLSFKQRYTNWNKPFNLVHTMVTSTKWICVCVVTLKWDIYYLCSIVYSIYQSTHQLTNYLFFIFSCEPYFC